MLSATVASRLLFYDNSKYDGKVAGVNAGDDAAIATDKTALISGQASFANVTSYVQGINGLMIDISGSHPGITADDFSFYVGSDSSPQSWAPAPAPLATAVRAGAGSGGADRVEIVWADGAIRNQWLQVVVAANANTGLATSDVFYFGNAVGDTGEGNDGSAVVNSADEIAVRGNNKNLLNKIPPSNPYDFNRNGTVDALDELVARNSPKDAAHALPFISIASPGSRVLTASLAHDTGAGGIDNNDGITKDPTVVGHLALTPDISGLLIGVNGKPVTFDASGVVQGDGSFTLDPALLDAANGGPIADGDCTINVLATYEHGLTSFAQVHFTLKRTLALPSLPDLIDADDSGSSSTDNFTNVSAPHIDAVGPVGSHLRLMIDGVLTGLGAPATPGSTFQFSLSPLADGQHTIAVVATDDFGNTSTSPPLTITISTVAPSVTLVTPATFTDDVTPRGTVTASSPQGLPNGTQVRVDVDLNNDGDFADAGETARTLTDLYQGTSNFQITPAIPYTTAAAGPYIVRLQAHVVDPAGNEGTSTPWLLKIDTLGNDILKNYVTAPDPTYSYSLARTITSAAYTSYVIDLKSQTWRTTADVSKTVWQHWMQIIVPKGALASTALLRINGGSTSTTAPTTVDTALANLAVQLHAVVVNLPTIPNQPLTFTGDPLHLARTEDQIISYTMQQYMTHLGEPGNETWPLLLPMVKSVVRAMDAVQSYVPTVTSTTINDFVVTGYSKRGWTTWLTAAVDDRVKAIIPGVFDDLNMDEQMVNHFGYYGYFSAQLNDYAAYNIPANSFTTLGQTLNPIFDPYRYLNQNSHFANMPKLILNGSGDEYFVPTSSQLYFHDLPGTQNYLRYFPNAGHKLNDIDPIKSTASFFDAVVNNYPLPQFDWTIQSDGTIRVQTNTPPTAVVMYAGTNPNGRNFSFTTVGGLYQATLLTDQGGGVYLANMPQPAAGATAYFIELTFPSGVPGSPFVFTTDINLKSSTPAFNWPFYMPTNVASAAQTIVEQSPESNAVAVSLAVSAVVDDAKARSQQATSAAAGPPADTNDAEDKTVDALTEDWSWVELDDASQSDSDAVDLALAELEGAELA